MEPTHRSGWVLVRIERKRNVKVIGAVHIPVLAGRVKRMMGIGKADKGKKRSIFVFLRLDVINRSVPNIRRWV